MNQVRFEMNVNSRFVRPKLLDDLQAEQDIVQNFLEINKAESQEKQVGMDSDGEDEIVEDEVPKAETAKVSEVVAKVSLSTFFFSSPFLKTDKFCYKAPWKTVSCLKHVLKNKLKLKPKPLFNDNEDDILFPKPLDLLMPSIQKSMVSPPKVLGRGDKVHALDTIPEMLEGKHGYLDMTWRLGELVHI